MHLCCMQMQNKHRPSMDHRATSGSAHTMRGGVRVCGFPASARRRASRRPSSSIDEKAKSKYLRHMLPVAITSEEVACARDY